MIIRIYSNNSLLIRKVPTPNFASQSSNAHTVNLFRKIRTNWAHTLKIFASPCLGNAGRTWAGWTWTKWCCSTVRYKCSNGDSGPQDTFCHQNRSTKPLLQLFGERPTNTCSWSWVTEREALHRSGGKKDGRTDWLTDWLTGRQY
jgi:hypothetical protein